jgi:hypothetical protein
MKREKKVRRGGGYCKEPNCFILSIFPIPVCVTGRAASYGSWFRTWERALPMAQAGLAKDSSFALRAPAGVYRKMKEERDGSKVGLCSQKLLSH